MAIMLIINDRSNNIRRRGLVRYLAAIFFFAKKARSKQTGKQANRLAGERASERYGRNNIHRANEQVSDDEAPGNSNERQMSLI